MEWELARPTSSVRLARYFRRPGSVQAYEANPEVRRDFLPEIHVAL